MNKVRSIKSDQKYDWYKGEQKLGEETEEKNNIAIGRHFATAKS